MNPDDDLDELDPVAAPAAGFGAGPGERVDEAELDVLARSDEPWRPEFGFPDGHGVLRVWTDDTGLITKVRVSASWRERLGKTHLSMPFAQAFALVNSYFPVDTAPVLQHDDQRHARYPLSWERLDQVTRTMDLLSRQLDALDPGLVGHWEGKLALGTSPDKLVAIELTHQGQLGRIIFNKAKLEESRVRQVTDGVVRAHAEARANYTPPTYVETERDQLVAQISDLRNETLAMMRRGFR